MRSPKSTLLAVLALGLALPACVSELSSDGCTEGAPCPAGVCRFQMCVPEGDGPGLDGAPQDRGVRPDAQVDARLADVGAADAQVDGALLDAEPPDLGVDAAPVDASLPADATPPECQADDQLPCDGLAEGACEPGARACIDGQWGATCEGAVTPAAEACDAVDNDCDGRVDEQGVPCVAGQGACEREGLTACDGPRVECVLPPVDAPEACNGVDDDCDGAVDEGFPVGRGCGAGVGACAARGVEVCADDGAGTGCDAAPGPGGVEACNGLDDDCDGTSDEGAVCADFCDVEQPRACGADQGRCTPGLQRCVDNTWGPCEGAVGPRPEVCDGQDDDCDGQLDEGLADLGDCTAGRGACARPGQLQCVEGGRRCTAVAGQPQAETCNGVDDDCDGAVDNDPSDCQAAERGQAACLGGQCQLTCDPGWYDLDQDPAACERGCGLVAGGAHNALRGATEFDAVHARDPEATLGVVAVVGGQLRGVFGGQERSLLGADRQALLPRHPRVVGLPAGFVVMAHLALSGTNVVVPVIRMRQQEADGTLRNVWVRGTIYELPGAGQGPGEPFGVQGESFWLAYTRQSPEGEVQQAWAYESRWAAVREVGVGPGGVELLPGQGLLVGEAAVLPLPAVGALIDEVPVVAAVRADGQALVGSPVREGGALAEPADGVAPLALLGGPTGLLAVQSGTGTAVRVVRARGGLALGEPRGLEGVTQVRLRGAAAGPLLLGMQAFVEGAIDGERCVQLPVTRGDDPLRAPTAWPAEDCRGAVYAVAGDDQPGAVVWRDSQLALGLLEAAVECR